MKKTLFWFYFSVAACNTLHAQSPALAVFNARLRDFDLNDALQNHYAITATEYDTLLLAWQELSPADKLELSGRERYYWEDAFAEMLLCDFVLGATWEEHVQKMMQLGARDLALTLSRNKSPITVATARSNLADLLHKGPSMMADGRFKIPEEIKLAAQTRVGNTARKRLQAWEDLINRLPSVSAKEQLEAVNTFFNRTIAANTEAQGNDYWQSPLETLAAGSGDCDDYAVAKYVSLRMLGIAPEQLRFGVVSQPSVGNHAVLLFFPTQEESPWVLDNLGSTRLSTNADEILPLRTRANLDGMQLLWGMNEKTLSQFQNNVREKKISSFPYQKFRAAATTFTNSFRLLPRSAWNQCDGSNDKGCICYRLGIWAGLLEQ